MLLLHSELLVLPQQRRNTDFKLIRRSTLCVLLYNVAKNTIAPSSPSLSCLTTISKSDGFDTLSFSVFKLSFIVVLTCFIHVRFSAKTVYCTVKSLNAFVLLYLGFLGFFSSYKEKELTGAYSNRDAIKYELSHCHQWVHNVHEHSEPKMCWTAVEGDSRCTSWFCFLCCASHFVHTNWFSGFHNDSWVWMCRKEHAWQRWKPREMAHCDVVYPNTECNTVNVVETFSNG